MYANHEQYSNSSDVISMNFVEFATTFKVVNGKLTNLPPNAIPRIFPTYSSNPKGANLPAYCKYQLLRYKPWKFTPNNAWNDQEPSDKLFVRYWNDVLQTPYAQNHVTDWYDKLQNVIQNQEANDEEQVVLETTCDSREEWMIIADLRMPFENNDGQSSFDNWQQDRTRYTEQQIGEMPTWIKNHKEQANYVNAQSHETILVNSFSEMQKLAYEIIKRHFENSRNSAEKDPLCLIVTGGAGTGKSYLINGVRNLLQDKCAVTATTAKASYNVKGVTIHSSLKLPVGPRGNKDLTGQNLCRLRKSLSAIDYILIDEYSMLGQTLLGWTDKRCKQAFGCHDKVLGGKSLVLIFGDPGKLPPVADKPLYREKPSNTIGEQGFQTYQMFDKVVKLNVNQNHEEFRNLLLRLRKGESTYEDWQILLSRQPSNIVDISQFNDAVRLFYSNEQVATYNYEQLIKTAHVNQFLKSMLLISLSRQKRYLVMKCQVCIQQYTLLKELK